MNDRPGGNAVACPECDVEALAIVPRGSTIVEREENADGKVRVDCRSCDNQFVAHYRTNR